MHCTPRAGEPYQLCKHLSAAGATAPEHIWSVPGRVAWVVLCGECHKRMGQRIGAALSEQTGNFATSTPPAPSSDPAVDWQKVLDKLTGCAMDACRTWSERQELDAARKQLIEAQQRQDESIRTVIHSVQQSAEAISRLSARMAEREIAATERAIAELAQLRQDGPPRKRARRTQRA